MDDELPDGDPDVKAGMKRLRELHVAKNGAIEFLAAVKEQSAPHCPECTTHLELGGTDEHPYWFCPECHVARLD